MSRRSLFVIRAEAIRRVEDQLRGRGYPRLQMLLLVTLTGAFGLLASFSMLQLGLDSMALRYPVAVGLAYLFFLALIWLWLRTKADAYAEIPDLSALVPTGGAPGDTACMASGGGGDFGGGGASGTFDAPLVDAGSELGSPVKTVGEAMNAAGDADELAIPLIALVVLAGLAFASLYVVYVAPVLFAELLVDGALAYALLRRMRAEDRPEWWAGAVKHTWLPFMITGLFLAGMGAAMSVYAPGAKSIGQVMAHSAAK